MSNLGGPPQVSRRWTGPDPALLVEQVASLVGTQASSHLLSSHKGPVLCQQVVVILTLSTGSEEARRIFHTKNCNTDISIVAVVLLPDEKIPRVRER